MVVYCHAYMNMDNTTHISKLLAYDALRPSQLFCSRVGMFPGLNQYLERFCPRASRRVAHTATWTGIRPTTE